MKFNTKTRKAFATLLAFSFIASPALGAITEADITNVYPDNEVLDRGTTVTVTLLADSTTTTDVNLWVKKPDGSWMKSQEVQNVEVSNNRPRGLSLDIQDESIQQYGHYILKVNETVNGLSDTVSYEIPAIANTDIHFSQESIESQRYAVVNVNPLDGTSISSDAIEDSVVNIYRVERLSSGNIDKDLIISKSLNYSDTTGDLETVIDTSDLDSGQYELNTEYNISSCGSCESYYETESIEFSITDGSSSDEIFGIPIIELFIALIILVTIYSVLAE